MNIISHKKLSLIAKLIVSYILLLDFAFLIFALTAEPTTDISSVVASLLGWTATLFTPVAAYILYDTWKDQKQYELEKSYAEKAIEIAYTINTHFNKCYYSYMNLNKIDNNFIYLNKKTKNTDFPLTQYQYDLDSTFFIIQKISNNKLNGETYKKFEDYTIALSESLDLIDEAYDKYYTLLDPTYKNDKIKVVPKYNRQIKNIAVELDLKNKFNIERIIAIDHNFEGEITKYTNSIHGFKDCFNETFSQFIDDLITLIKI